MLVAVVVAQMPAVGHDLPPAAAQEPVPFVTEGRRRVVFALDASIAMHQLDPQRLCLQGLRKLLHALTPDDEAGLLLHDADVEAAIPPAPVTDETAESIMVAASGDARVAAGNLSRQLDAALALVGDVPDGAVGAVVVVSSARMPGGEDIEAATTALQGSVEAYAAAGVTLYAIAVGPFSDRARTLAAMLQHSPSLDPVETGNGLPAAFGKVLQGLQAYAQRPQVARLDPDAEATDERQVRQAIHVSPYADFVQLDVVSEADTAGVIPFQIQLADPTGALVAPTFVGVGNAFYRIARPMSGEWRYQVQPARRARLTHHAVIQGDPKIVHYYPAAVERGKSIDLHFAVVAHGEPISGDTFRLRGVSYSVVAAEVTFVAPDASAATARAEMQDLTSRYAGEYTLTDWRGDITGRYDVSIAVGLEAGRGPDARMLVMRNTDPIAMRVVDDRGELPLVALSSVMPATPLAGPIALRGADDRPHELSFSAQVLAPGVGAPAAHMLGRTIRASVKHGSGYRLVEDATGDGRSTVRAGVRTQLTGRASAVGLSGPVFLTPDVTAPGRVRYTFPSVATSSRDRIHLQAPGYYRVELLEGPTYRVDPTWHETIRHVEKKALLRFLRPEYVPPPEAPPLPPGPELNRRRSGDPGRERR